jgi:hypothetical protein
VARASSTVARVMRKLLATAALRRVLGARPGRKAR